MIGLRHRLNFYDAHILFDGPWSPSTRVHVAVAGFRPSSPHADASGSERQANGRSHVATMISQLQ